MVFDRLFPPLASAALLALHRCWSLLTEQTEDTTSDPSLPGSVCKLALDVSLLLVSLPSDCVVSSSTLEAVRAWAPSEEWDGRYLRGELILDAELRSRILRQALQLWCRPDPSGQDWKANMEFANVCHRLAALALSQQVSSPL